MIYIMRTNLTVRASLLTLILAFIAIGTFAFTKVVMKKENIISETKSEIVTVNFAFSGPSPNEASYVTKSNWNLSTGSESCLGSYKPCVVAITEPGVTTPEELADFLQQMADNNQDVEAYIAARTISHQN